MPPCDPLTRAEDLLRERGSFTSGELAERSGLSRQALQRHLARWVAGGSMVREGRGRGTRYRRADRALFERVWPAPGLEEDEVWSAVAAWLHRAGGAPRPAEDILRDAMTELVSNAVEHAAAPEVRVRVVREEEHLRLAVTDEGIGAFERLRRGLGLDDHLHALQELSKGKVTTRPEGHTGEGIFFVSKAVDRFELTANGLVWTVDNVRRDQAVSTASGAGTLVRLEVSLATRATLAEVFARYTHDRAFDTTRCTIRLFEIGTTFVSRSEARRLVSGLEKFREVILDFEGVRGVGQGFVDEVFRVWARAHPDVVLTPVGMNEVVEFMVRRGLPRARGEAGTR